jgi:hypothetical protein
MSSATPHRSPLLTELARFNAAADGHTAFPIKQLNVRVSFGQQRFA